VSQTEIARRLNVSQMHVSRLQAKALDKLRSFLAE
jgi:DNA-directed RNA polymerase specialized sigma subunit